MGGPNATPEPPVRATFIHFRLSEGPEHGPGAATLAASLPAFPLSVRKMTTGGPDADPGSFTTLASGHRCVGGDSSPILSRGAVGSGTSSDSPVCTGCDHGNEWYDMPDKQ